MSGLERRLKITALTFLYRVSLCWVTQSKIRLPQIATSNSVPSVAPSLISFSILFAS